MAFGGQLVVGFEYVSAHLRIFSDEAELCFKHFKRNLLVWPQLFRRVSNEWEAGNHHLPFFVKADTRFNKMLLSFLHKRYLLDIVAILAWLAGAAARAAVSYLTPNGISGQKLLQSSCDF